MFTIGASLLCLLGVCALGTLIKMRLNRSLEEFDGVHEVHQGRAGTRLWL